MSLIACCFTGHKRIADKDIPSLKQNLNKTIEHLIRQGVSTFLCGGALGFDMLAGYAVLGFKEKYSTIMLVMVLPCQNQDRNWASKDKAAYGGLLAAADGIFYISDEYYPGCMKKRNKELVLRSDYCLAYMKRVRTGTAQTVRFANKKGIPVINIADGFALV